MAIEKRQTGHRHLYEDLCCEHINKLSNLSFKKLERLKELRTMKHLLTPLGFAVLTSTLTLTLSSESVSQAATQPPPNAQATPATSTEPLYTQEGTDPAFAELLSQLPQGHNSIKGATGSIIHVNKRLVDVGPNANHPIARDIHIHTLGNSSIKREDFSKWSRWYQEDGNVQIFRLFKGETNIRNQRALAARVEAYGGHWAAGKTNEWHEWSGTYTIVKPGGANIFQDFSTGKTLWAFHLDMDAKGDVLFLPRHVKNGKRIIAPNMVGKPFYIRVRDNGLDYELYLNNEKVASGSYRRPDGKHSFRWGMYKGESEVNNDQMIFVTGATFQ